MRTTKFAMSIIVALVLQTQVVRSSLGQGLFKMDFGDLQNFDEVDEWDVFPTYSFFDCADLDFACIDTDEESFGTWKVTDWSKGGDDDVTLTMMDQLELADETGSFATGMTANNPVPQELDVEYDGIEVPAPVKDDYLYRLPDTAGTEILFRWDNLDPGKYSVTVFQGRTDDANGQFGKIWVDADPTGGGEIEEENTDDFSSLNEPEGIPRTLEVEVNTGQHLWYAHMEDNSGGISGIILRQTESFGGGAGPILQAGDADRDLDFDQLDLVKVQIAGKYLTGQAATWGDGDWNGAPGGNVDAPPVGDGLFNQLDIIAAVGNGLYLAGPYAAIQPGGNEGDEQTSLVYQAATGELSVDAPAGKELTSINITSAGNKFIGDQPAALDGAFDNFGADNLFKATFGGSFGSISFGSVLPAGIAENELANDLSVVGSLAGGGDLGDVDLVYIPEPTSMFLFAIAFVILSQRSRRVVHRH